MYFWLSSYGLFIARNELSLLEYFKATLILPFFYCQHFFKATLILFAASSSREFRNLTIQQSQVRYAKLLKNKSFIL